MSEDQPDAPVLLHREFMASARTTKSLLSRFMGANNCLELSIGTDQLTLKSHWTFLQFWVRSCGLELTIPISEISRVTTRKILFTNVFEVEIVPKDGAKPWLLILGTRYPASLTNAFVQNEIPIGKDD